MWQLDMTRNYIVTTELSRSPEAYTWTMRWEFLGTSTYTRKNAQLVTILQQTCSKLVETNLLQDLFALLVPGLLKSFLQQTCYKLDELNSLVASCCNNVYRAASQQLVNKLWVTHLVQLDKMTALLQLVDKLVANTTCWQDVRFLRV